VMTNELDVDNNMNKVDDLLDGTKEN
jgi:hypothetical protein